MGEPLKFDYYYGIEAEQFSFYRVPRLLIKDERFKGLSSDAKLLYGLMLDRMSLSMKNGWLDDENRAYIIYAVENIMEDLGCSKPTCIKVIRELDVDNGIGLIEKKRRGLGKPDIIYVKNFASVPEKESGGEALNTDVSTEVKNLYFKKERNLTSESKKTELPEGKETDFKREKNLTSGSKGTGLQEVKGFAPNYNNTNYNDQNHTDMSYPNPIDQSVGDVDSTGTQGKEDTIDVMDETEQLHRGVDIAVPTGTTVLAAMDGTVTTAAYDSYYGNYIVIEDSNGYCTKYAHMDTLSVSAGQAVKHGDTIGITGNTGSSTGSHLHIECQYNGEYYNPLFYFEAGEGTLYGETNAPGSGGGNAIPPDSYDDATVQALMEEAAKYLGFPYVWGGSSPSTSFDCSGFVCWVFTNSGVHNLPRTTAQGIYDQCTPVSAADAKAGDIIFFTGTYNSGGAVSHVGIYCGNGVMIHAGDPIKYSNINTSYWQSHFYAFGRLN